MFAKVNHVVNLKGKKKQIKSVLIGEKGFRSLIFVLDGGYWPSSNLPKCATRLCFLDGLVFSGRGRDSHTI